MWYYRLGHRRRRWLDRLDDYAWHAERNRFIRGRKAAGWVVCGPRWIAPEEPVGRLLPRIAEESPDLPDR